MKIDKKTIQSFKEKWVEKIKLFFYDAWCSWTKLDIEENPDITNLILCNNIDWIDVYCSENNKDKFVDCNITKTVSEDHTWKEKVRYIYTSTKVKDRCGCWSSFSFSEKNLQIDLNKLKDLKNNFKKWI